MGLFDFLTSDSADKLKQSNTAAYVDPTDPRIQQMLTQRAQGQLTPQEQSNVENQQVQAQNAVAGQAAAARGTNAGLAQRNAITQGAQAASAVAGQAQQTAAANQNFATGALNDINQSNRNAKINQTQFDTGMYNQATMNDVAQKNAMNQAITGGLIGAAGSWLGLKSDKNAKKNIESGSDDISSFLDHLKSWKYDYKQPEVDGDGKHVSVMAQDLEKSDIGKNAVQDTPGGKMVDYAKLLPTLLAATADMHQRIKKMEK